MNIMHIVPCMEIGGTETGVLDIASFFKNEKTASGACVIRNIVVSAGGRLIKGLEAQGIKCYKLPVHKKSILSLFLIPKIKKIIDDEKIDIIHAHSRVPAWISFFASRNTRAYFITTAHGVYRNPFFSEVMGWGKVVICPSKVVARHMKNNFRVPQDKIIIINRWVDLNKFKFTEYRDRAKINIVVSVGRISSSKGYEHLIKAFKRIVRSNPYLKLKIVGSCDKSKMKYIDYLKTLVKRFSLNYNVEFIGFRPDIEDVLKDSRILVAPSVIEESFGRVVIEAFACGVPVIATKVGGFKEIIEDGHNGILVDPKNDEQIADAVLKLLDNSEYAESLANRAREKTQRYYYLENCLKEIRGVYEETIANLNILVIKISSLGDLILSFPSLAAIRQKFPRSKISLLTLKKYHGLVFDCPYIDEVIVVDGNYKKLKNILGIVSNLRRKSFDYIIDLQNSKASHVISFLSFARYSFGFSLRLGFLLSKKIRYDRTMSPLKSQESILQFLGIRLKEEKLVFWQKKAASSISLPKAQLIGINMSASLRWKSKNWPLKNIQKLIGLINKNLPNFRVVLLGGEDAVARGEKIEKSLWPHPLNLCGKTKLNELGQVLGALSVFITPDTAALHLSCALNVPTIALFGPTDPQRHTVKSKNLHVFCVKLPCSFCYKPKCGVQKEPLCLEKVSAQAILTKIREIVRR